MRQYLSPSYLKDITRNFEYNKLSMNILRLIVNRFKIEVKKKLVSYKLLCGLINDMFCKYCVDTFVK